VCDLPVVVCAVDGNVVGERGGHVQDGTHRSFVDETAIVVLTRNLVHQVVK